MASTHFTATKKILCGRLGNIAPHPFGRPSPQWSRRLRSAGHYHYNNEAKSTYVCMAVPPDSLWPCPYRRRSMRHTCTCRNPPPWCRQSSANCRSRWWWSSCRCCTPGTSYSRTASPLCNDTSCTSESCPGRSPLSHWKLPIHRDSDWRLSALRWTDS